MITARSAARWNAPPAAERPRLKGCLAPSSPAAGRQGQTEKLIPLAHHQPERAEIFQRLLDPRGLPAQSQQIPQRRRRMRLVATGGIERGARLGDAVGARLGLIAPVFDLEKSGRAPKGHLRPPRRAPPLLPDAHLLLSLIENR